MKNEEIIVDIDEQGNPTIEVKGHVGPGCAELTKNLEKALGATAKDTKKPEFNQRTQQKQTLRR